MKILRLLCFALTLSVGTANAETYLCNIKARYGTVTIAPELAVQVFRNSGTARVIDGVTNTVRDEGAFGRVEKRPAVMQVTWEMILPTRDYRSFRDKFTYRVSIWPDGRAVVTGQTGRITKRARSTGHCRVSDKSLEEIGTFGKRLDRPLRKF